LLIGWPLMLHRIAACLAGLWAGVLLGVGLIGAPAGFAVAPSEIAGRSAGRMFAIEADASMAVAVLLLLALRNIKKELPSGSSIDGNVLLVLGSLFCTIAGYWVLQPMMAAARAGEGALSFGALHGLAAAFFAVKALCVVWLAWRLTSGPNA
jgi:hypothetical protein